MNSFTTTGGQVIPTESESQVRDAIRLADQAHKNVGDGGGWDDPRLRAHLTARAKARGIPHIIPAGWGRESAGKSAGVTELYKLDVSRVDAVATPANGIGTLLMKSLPSPPAAKWADWPTVARQTGEAIKAIAKANGCALRSAEIEMTTPAEAHEALKKAAEYRRMADTLTDRASADSYRQLAKKILKEAGME
jgi:hypothetical protein